MQNCTNKLTHGQRLKDTVQKENIYQTVRIVVDIMSERIPQESSI